jgi:hypothetical protein
MVEKRTIDDRNDNGNRTAKRGAGSDTHAIEPEHHYVDPAEEAMSSNPNLSPPIHPNPN